jgi:hypothetical protein
VSKSKTKSERLSYLEQLNNTIEQRLIECAPDGLMANEVGKGLSCAKSTVNTRLEALLQAGRVHRVRHTQAGRYAIYYTWHAGAKPEDAYEAPICPNPGAVPHRPTFRKYPPINRRDSLVEALFGPARQEAA